MSKNIIILLNIWLFFKITRGITLPFWAFLFSNELKKQVNEIDVRLMALELEVKVIKRKLLRNGIK